MYPEFTDWVFHIETIPEIEDEPWWATLSVCGTLAVGSGSTPWLAIKAVFKDIGPTIDRCREMDRLFDLLQAGELTCEGCGKKMEPMSDDNPVAGLVCEDYPSCGNNRMIFEV